MRRDALGSLGAALAALVASSHHALHVALLSAGLGAASFLFDPLARRVLLALSLAMTALSAWWFLRRRARTGAEVAAVAFGSAISLGLVAWSVAAHGW